MTDEGVAEQEKESLSSSNLAMGSETFRSTYIIILPKEYWGSSHKYSENIYLYKLGVWKIGMSLRVTCQN